MSSASTLKIILETGEETPGTAKRNRSRVSCLNCYASKRKCDRKRPCTRCIKLGLTGLCVYELDDPSSRNQKNFNENEHLKKRIAELESLLRQLKNKPHPRWTAPGGVVHDLGLVAERRRSRRRLRADSVRSASVETFFAAGAQSDEEDGEVKVEHGASFVPEFTPSEVEYPDDLQSNPRARELTLSEVEYPDNSEMDTQHSPHRISTPFAFGEKQGTEVSPICPPLSSFVQSMPTDVTSLVSSKSRGGYTSPYLSESSTAEPRLLNKSIFDVATHPSARSTFNITTENDSVDTMTPGVNVFESFVLPGAPLIPSKQSSSIDGKRASCPCLNATPLFSPLLHLAVTLRTSREALQMLHPPATDCELFQRILELEDHIFSATPPPREASHVCDAEGSAASPIPGALTLFPPPPQQVVDPPVAQPYLPSFSVEPYSSTLSIHRYDMDAFSHLAEPSSLRLSGWK